MHIPGKSGHCWKRSELPLLFYSHIQTRGWSGIRMWTSIRIKTEFQKGSGFGASPDGLQMNWVNPARVKGAELNGAPSLHTSTSCSRMIPSRISHDFWDLTCCGPSVKDRCRTSNMTFTLGTEKQIRRDETFRCFCLTPEEFVADTATETQAQTVSLFQLNIF